MKKIGYQAGGLAGKRVIFALLAGAVILLAGSVGFTSLVLSGQISEGHIPAVSLALLICASIIGTVVASAGEGDHRIAVAAFCAILYLTLLGGNVAMFGGDLERIGACSVAVLSGVLVGVGLKFLPVTKPGVKGYKHRFR